MNEFEFSILDKFEDVVSDLNEQQKSILNEPSYLTELCLLSSWSKKTYRMLDFTGTTIEEAIKKILKFYTHKTFRRQIGDHIYFEGFTVLEHPYGMNTKAILLGS